MKDARKIIDRQKKYAPGELFEEFGKKYKEDIRYDGDTERYLHRLANVPITYPFFCWDKKVASHPVLMAIVEKNAELERTIVEILEKKNKVCRRDCCDKLHTMIFMGDFYMQIQCESAAVKLYEETYDYLKKKLHIQ